MSIKKVGLSILRGVLNEIEIQKWLNKNISLKKDTLFIENKKISLPKNGKAILICTGKSASSLAYAFQKKLNKKIKHTYIFSPKKYYKKYPLKKTTTYLGTHPKINKKTLKNTESFLNKIENHKKTDFYIFLISGGTSSSIEKLKKHISLKKYNQLINEMIFSGQSINKINRIRTSLSEVKGGKILKFFKLPNYTVRVSAPLKPTFEGEVENVQRISDKPIDLIFQNIEVVKDINSFFNLNNSCFFSPVYIGKAKRIQDRLFQHKQLISDLKNATRTIEIELSSNDVKFDTSEFAFAKEFVKRSIPLDWLYFSYCDLSNSKISESYEAIESIMNRINFPLMGRN